jgi:hypothetical protein
MIKQRALLNFIVLAIFLLIIGCSNTGDLSYQYESETPINKKFGQNITIAILDFPDERPPIKGFLYSKGLQTKPEKNLVGMFFGGFKIRLRRLYSKKAINLCVVEALGNLFKASGFNVIQYNDASDSSSIMHERLVVKGKIKDFFVHGYPGTSIVAQIEIDVTIVDNKYQKTIWNDNILAYRRMGRNTGVFTGTEKTFSFLNRVFSDAIEYAWFKDGMRSALKGLRS